MKTHLINSIFKENLKYLPKWQGALANHVSMAAVAMFEMKKWVRIDDSEIENQAKKYTENLTLNRKNSSAIDLQQIEWPMQKSLLGHDEYYESWKRFFLKELADKDAKEVISLWLSRLGAGISAAAGHSVIRLAYAVMAASYLEQEVFVQEIATCLADYASRYFPLSDETIINDSVQRIPLDQYILAHKVLPKEQLSLLSSCNLIEDKYFLCRNFPEFHEALSKVNTEIDFEIVLKNLASISVTNPSFALLHCITLAHALLCLYDYLPEFNKKTLSQGYRDYVVAAILTNNLNRQSFEIKGATLEQVYQQVEGLQDDHSQKIAFTLTALYKRYGAQIFLEAAVSFSK